MGGLSSVIKLACDGMRDNRLLWALIAVFALFPIFTHFADLPFWNDVAMRIMLLGMAAMGLNLVLGYGGMVSLGMLLLSALVPIVWRLVRSMASAMVGCILRLPLSPAALPDWLLAIWRCAQAAFISL